MILKIIAIVGGACAVAATLLMAAALGLSLVTSVVAGVSSVLPTICILGGVAYAASLGCTMN